METVLCFQVLARFTKHDLNLILHFSYDTTLRRRSRVVHVRPSLVKTAVFRFFAWKKRVSGSAESTSDGCGTPGMFYTVGSVTCEMRRGDSIHFEFH